MYTLEMESSTAPPRSTLILGLFSGVAAASTAAIFIRFAQQNGAPSIVIAAARLTIATLILAPVIFLRHWPEIKRLKTIDWILALLGGFFLALHFATWISSLEFTTVASSAVLVSTAPLWVAILSPIVLRERVGLAAVIGLALALLGGVIIGAGDACSWQAGYLSCSSANLGLGKTAFWGDLLALCGAWLAAGYMLVGRKLRSRVSLLPYIFIVYGAAAVVLLTVMLGTKSNPLGLPASTFVWFLLLAIIPQLFGHSTFNWALKYLPASFVSISLLGEPIGSTILALIIFQEVPDVIKIGGGILILLGIWLASRRTA